jgi:hypothetical protein
MKQHGAGDTTALRGSTVVLHVQDITAHTYPTPR